MKKIITCLTTLLCLVAFSSSVQALPRFALQKGLKCISCHINPTGGVQRNSYGSLMFGRNELPVPAHDSPTEFNSNLTDQLALGADIRMQFLYDGNNKQSTFQAMQGGLYLTAFLNPHITLFGKYDIINQDFEAFGLLNFWNNKFILKMGSFAPAYGIRLDDHTSYTRGGNLGFFQGLVPPGYSSIGLIFYPNYKEVGVEGTAYFGKSITVNLAVTNGFQSGFNNYPINFSKDKALIGRVEYFSKINSVNYFVGGSYYNGLANLSIQGGFLGFSWNRITLLTEVDQAKNIFGISTAEVRLAEFSYLVSQGFYAVFRYDVFDPTLLKPFSRFTIGAEYFPYSSIEIRPQYRINQAPDGTSASLKSFGEAVLQFHVWF